MRVLVINAGSSSVKLRLLGADDEQAWQGRLADALIE
jgi:acetate kinase